MYDGRSVWTPAPRAMDPATPTAPRPIFPSVSVAPPNASTDSANVSLRSSAFAMFSIADRFCPRVEFRPLDDPGRSTDLGFRRRCALNALRDDSRLLATTRSQRLWLAARSASSNNGPIRTLARFAPHVCRHRRRMPKADPSRLRPDDVHHERRQRSAETPCRCFDRQIRRCSGIGKGSDIAFGFGMVGISRRGND